MVTWPHPQTHLTVRLNGPQLISVDQSNVLTVVGQSSHVKSLQSNHLLLTNSDYHLIVERLKKKGHCDFSIVGQEAFGVFVVNSVLSC